MSRRPQSADPQLDDAAGILRAARRRALGTRPSLRLLAITAWSAFIGAVALFAAFLLALPHEGEPLGFGRLAAVFVVLWALAAIPALTAAMLARLPAAAFEPPRGQSRSVRKQAP